MGNLVSRLFMASVAAGVLAVSSCDKPNEDVSFNDGRGREIEQPAKTRRTEESTKTDYRDKEERNNSQRSTDSVRGESYVLDLKFKGGGEGVSEDALEVFERQRGKVSISYSGGKIIYSQADVRIRTDSEGGQITTGFGPRSFYIVAPKEIVLPIMDTFDVRGYAHHCFSARWVSIDEKGYTDFKIGTSYLDSFSDEAGKFILSFINEHKERREDSRKDFLFYIFSSSEMQNMEVKNPTDKDKKIGVFFGTKVGSRLSYRVQGRDAFASESFELEPRGFVFTIPPSR